VAAKPCSCPGDKILSTCEEGDTCNDDGSCCPATGWCQSGASYIPEAYFFNNCTHSSRSSDGACKYTDGVTSNYDSSTESCCCLDQSIDVYNNSDLCWMSNIKEFSYEYCYNGGFDAYCSIIKFCSVGIAATEICSCPGDKILSTCYIGEVCGTDGKCCAGNGECFSGSKDEMYLSRLYPAVDMSPIIPAVDYLQCKHTNGSTSDQKDCECGRYK